MQVAWYIMGEEPQALGPAVERLVSSVIEQVGPDRFVSLQRF